MLTTTYHLHALTALHVGSGQSTGIVDLPIMRARATQLPIVPGSALKGVLRDEFANHAQLDLLFGPSSSAASLHAGALTLGDANLLALPVRSLVNIMAYATCPFILRQYARDRQLNLATPAADTPALTTGPTLLHAEQVWIDDLDLPAREDPLATAWAQAIASAVFPRNQAASKPEDAQKAQGDNEGQEAAESQNFFCQHFLILPDDAFAFLAENATEIRARIRIDDASGTVADGALWYEENLPAETLLWGQLGLTHARRSQAADNPAPAATASDLAQAFQARMNRQALLQIGGKATVGRGLCRFLSAPLSASEAQA